MKIDMMWSGNKIILKLTAKSIFDFHFTTLQCLFVKLCQKSIKVNIALNNQIGALWRAEAS